MASLGRRIQKAMHRTGRDGTKRGIFYQGRGSKLGVVNPQCKCLLARRRREEKWGRA